MSRRVAIITDANAHLGPDLARKLAARDHDLVLGDPLPGLADELSQTGVSVEVVEGVEDLAQPEAVCRLVDSAQHRFGRLDAACIRTGRIIGGTFLEASIEDLHELVALNLASVFHALKALLPPMQEAGGGQIVMVTSAAGVRAVPNAALYSATRAGANMMIKNAALAVAGDGVTVNALGTSHLDYPGFIQATGAGDPAVRKQIEAAVPMGRLGTTAEVAHFCASLLDGGNRFQTGQFFSLSGGWSD